MWIPKFQYPVAGTILTLTRPMGLWEPRTERIGGHRRAAVQTVSATFTVARLRQMDFRIRFTELEYSEMEAMVEWMQDNPMTASTFWPDVDVPGTSYSVFLVAPMDDFAPGRNPEFESDRETTLTFMRSSGASWGDLPYFDS